MPLRTWLAVLLAGIILSLQPLARADTGTEAEARATFTKLVTAAKKRQVADFKKLIAKADLAEMEAMEQERAGMIAMMMEMIGADDPKQFKAQVKDGVATFVKSRKQKTKDMTSSETTTFTLIREGDQWKFGKPR